MTIGRFVESFFAEKVTLLYHFRGPSVVGLGFSVALALGLAPVEAILFQLRMRKAATVTPPLYAKCTSRPYMGT
ncbi:hypothetical protein CEXT_797781 [Caerostris extrusa]|uniref:Uncharacterized protein n=1 Tax=Caerostris extrusa TaxID=172846 RepID=A0AAV4PYA1_CAEEX|nr:hypothetical protein CEXT_797781 [Caerostris extrusa]